MAPWDRRHPCRQTRAGRDAGGPRTHAPLQTMPSEIALAPTLLVHICERCAPKSIPSHLLDLHGPCIVVGKRATQAKTAVAHIVVGVQIDICQRCPEP